MIKREITTQWLTEIPEKNDKNRKVKQKKHIKYLNKKDSIV